MHEYVQNMYSSLSTSSTRALSIYLLPVSLQMLYTFGKPGLICGEDGKIVRWKPRAVVVLDLQMRTVVTCWSCCRLQTSRCVYRVAGVLSHLYCLYLCRFDAVISSQITKLNDFILWREWSTSIWSCWQRYPPNNAKLIHWPLMGYICCREEETGWSCSPLRRSGRCTKCNSPPTNVQCTNHCTNQCTNHTFAASVLHSLKLAVESVFVRRIAVTYMYQPQGQNLANVVFALLHQESGTPCHSISVLLPSAENSSGRGSKPISLSAPTHDSPMRTIEECNYLLTYLLYLL